MRLIMNIVETASTSDSSHDSEEESLELLSDLKAQAAGFLPVIDGLAKQIQSIQARIEPERASPLTDALPIRDARVAAWFGATAARPTELVRKLLEASVVKADIETRRIWLQPSVSEALGLPTPIGFFDLMRAVGRWFGL